MPGPRPGHHGQQVGDLGNAVRAVFVAGADVAGAPQAQMLRIKRAAQRYSAGIGQTAQISVIACRSQRRAEQHRRAALGKVRRQKVTRVQAEHCGTDLTAVGRDLQYKVIVEHVRHAQPGADVKV